MTLLDHIRTLVEAEQGLTLALEKSLPLLPSSHDRQSSSSVVLSSSEQIEPPLLPTPRNADEVPTILAVARAYSLRTSAPPMWNPMLPVIGFATPNPLPHQLRGGALGAMQLKMAREEKSRKANELIDRRERERRRVEEDKKRMEAKKEETMDVDKQTTAGKRRQDENVETADPKRHELMDHRVASVASSGRKIKRQTTEEYRKNLEKINMNLSDSSSTEESSEEEEESD
mmetsp:Transcript_53914/g.114538  ORF Transcript_53914/g.114538 Transcript_53914/m.114538 type:complete len:230 (-) Transcript_53914:394-1083(-)|eukprot:CAMPEP_0172532286 /NCGR_PEP_ID=MMETSP1067-20121228/5399_1 /TAXON_ID=265564 ORGANISM="Thalassiosira punctigera, Strain Tpunct2005C2" /NCGR_SAMPLE_ID=MMETSP1067 /ASSEMBLY_ACC=CAM_ASM_000444 /LENGTH=229 /DNA_ID=CAMNT_0013316791 /DNA_START=13 /DNA_END=702 /DNA_ORIENTATION=+